MAEKRKQVYKTVNCYFDMRSEKASEGEGK